MRATAVHPPFGLLFALAAGSTPLAQEPGQNAPRRFAVILSGCGVYDGAEIHEAVMTLYAIEQHGGSYQAFAPEVDQLHTVNHLTGQVMDQTRNVLVESARIARGQILPLGQLDPGDFDALLLPGGFGVAKNLSSFAQDGPNCQVNPDVSRAIAAMHAQGKPIGALCIAPALLARVLGKGTLTVGTHPETAQAIEALGGSHTPSGAGQVVVDPANRLFSAPCYMLDASILDIAHEAKALVGAIYQHMHW